MFWDSCRVLSNTLACAALILSIITYILARSSARASERRSRIPVLVFVYDADRWLLRNVGNGPALNIVVAIKSAHDDVDWQRPTRIPPVGRDDSFHISWLRDADPAVIAASYEDFLAADSPGKSRSYSVFIEYDVNTVSPVRLLPRWDISQTTAHWEWNK